jgi:AraC-like DNA-binding protein
MQDITYEFVDLDSEESFRSLGQALGGVVNNNSLCFDNNIAKGELIRSAPDMGLWIRKWKFTVLQKLTLHKIPPPVAGEKKFILIYFLDPSIFSVKNKKKSFNLSVPRNNMFLTNEVPIDFSVLPKKPFYVLDVAFTATWLAEQLGDADSFCKDFFDAYINNATNRSMMECCSIEEYKLLHELELSMSAENEDVLFIRSRVYNLIVSFFNKVVNSKQTDLVQTTIHYDQIVKAEKLLMEDIKKPPKIDVIAQKVHLSVSSLIRQFKLMYGKGLYEYYVERKMELAKKMVLEDKITVKEMAAMLGYKQASPFIETFTKQHGCSPGTLKLASDSRLFY